MNDERWSRLRALFDEARDLSEEERRSFLDSRLLGEPDMRAEVEELLAADRAQTSFLTARKEPSPGGTTTGMAAGTVGPYRLVEPLGEGGFGVVYLAEQLRPIRRLVALKLIKPGMDTRQVIARFQAERQALALMDHPGIAQVFDAGETEAGHPYFVMEYVPGVSITKFCDEERLSVRDRLDLFLKVCDAVQHAHQKGVIHRDLKPSNVLVARRDGVVTLKIIDFGIVKATGASAGDRSFATREGMVIGTLGYMSPEQAGAIEAVLDTRSDIYSLGVLLYELLCGKPPFDPIRLRRMDWSEAVRVIREEDPPGFFARTTRPGSVAAPSAEARSDEIAEAARRRSTDGKGLLRQLVGELEWIARRALEKEPDRRYPSASELSADIRRYLADQPVLAGAPGTTYRLRKFARRHRAGFAVAAVVMFAIVAGGIAAAVGLSRAIRAERIARQEADAAQRVADFLVELFETADPNRSGGETVTARTLLDRGTRRIRTGLGQDPRVRTRLLTTLGNAHISLGLYDEGLSLLGDALAAAESARPPDEAEIARQLLDLASGMRASGRIEEVEPLVERSLRFAGDSNASAGLVSAALALRGARLNAQGQPAPAESLITAAIELCESQSGPDTLQLVRMYLTKAQVAHRRYALEDAERSYLKALELSALTGREPMASSLHSQLAAVYSALHQPEKALRHAREGVRLARQLYAPDHPAIAIALSGEASALISQDDYAQAATVREEALRILRANGSRDDLLAVALNSQGLLYRGLKRFDLAIERAEEATAINAKIYGPDNTRTAELLANLARYYADAKRMESADASFRRAVAVFDRLDTETIYAAYAYMGYGNLCRATGRLAQADTLYTRAEAKMDTAQAGMRPYVVECLADHAYQRSLQSRHADAESLMQASLALARRDGREFALETGVPHLLWAAARVRAGRIDEAMAELRKALRCGITREDAAEIRDLAMLHGQPDFPDSLRVHAIDDRAAKIP